MEKKGSYYSILGLYRDNGKENGSYYSILGYVGIMEKKMEATIVYWVM